MQTFPSGLVRVERSFACRPEDAARFRPQLAVGEVLPLDNGAPAIDGLFIFPEPQEFFNENGFVEFRVTAYGRTSLSGQRERRLENGFYREFRIGTIIDGFQTNTFQSFLPCLNEVLVQRIVIPSNAFPSITNQNIELSSFVLIDGEIKPIAEDVARRNPTQSNYGRAATEISTIVEPGAFDVLNFGRWDEATIVYTANTTVQFFS